MVEFRGQQIAVGAKMYLVAPTSDGAWGVDPITIHKITAHTVFLLSETLPKRKFSISKTAFLAVGGFKPDLYWTQQQAQDVADAINAAKACDKMLSRVAPIGEIWNPHLVPKHLIQQLHDATKAIYDWWKVSDK